MARTPEGKAKDAVDNLLDAAKCYWFCPTTGGYGSSGLPDRVGCFSGKFIGIEVKADTELTELQKMNLRCIMQTGGTAFVVQITTTGKVAGLKELALFLGVKDYEKVAFATRKKRKTSKGEVVRIDGEPDIDGLPR